MHLPEFTDVVSRLPRDKEYIISLLRVGSPANVGAGYGLLVISLND